MRLFSSKHTGVIITFALTGMITFTGCSLSKNDNGNNTTTENEAKVTDINIQDFAAMLANDITFSTKLEKVDYDFISGYFDIDNNTDAVMYTNNVTCEEVAVFKAPDENTASDIEKHVETFLSDQRATFAAYSPEDADRIDNAVTECSSVYVVMCVCDTPDDAKSLIDDVLSGKTTPAATTNGDSGNDDANKDPKDKETKEPSQKESKEPTENPTDATADPETSDDPGASKEYAKIESDGEIKKYGAVTVIGDTGFSFYSYLEDPSKKYADALNCLAETMSGKANVYSMPVVLASAITLPDNLAEEFNSFSDQNEGVEKINAMLSDNVKKINMYETLMQHRSEYLFFRTDHHWTALGAYYAYTDFCKAKGIEAEALDSYEQKVFDNFKGSYVSDTGDSALSDNPDTITAYLPNASSTKMHVVASDGTEYDWPIINDVTNYKSGVKYSAFAAGDNSITTLTNNDITDNSACIVVKDSFGNAFVPFLVDHYHTVYEIDFRYWSGNIPEFAEANNVSDILFVMNICNTGNSYSVGKVAQLCSK